ncbi:16622_t:CDS:1, partial [Racocetra fulgida]
TLILSICRSITLFPHDPEFENLTYPQYFEKYLITPSPPPSMPCHVYRDDLSNY